MSSPTIPDPNKSAMAGAQADLNNFPLTYILNALSKMGGKANVQGKEYDFTGLGDADVSANVSDKMAQTLLDIQKNLGPKFVQQRIDELKLADPTGYAARKQLFDKIIADSNANPDRPLAEETQQQIMGLLQKGGTLDPKQTEQVQQGVRGQQLAGGIYLGNASANQEASAVEQAGEGQRTKRQEQAQEFLSSGVSPEDVEYRRIMQNLQNLEAFNSGQTPMAQFGSLSSSGNGAAPLTPGQPVNTSTDPNAALTGMQNGATQYAGQVNWANHQVNPFVGVTSGILNTAGTAANMGWNPFQQQAAPYSNAASWSVNSGGTPYSGAGAH